MAIIGATAKGLSRLFNFSVSTLSALTGLSAAISLAGMGLDTLSQGFSNFNLLTLSTGLIMAFGGYYAAHSGYRKLTQGYGFRARRLQHVLLGYNLAGIACLAFTGYMLYTTGAHDAAYYNNAYSAEDIVTLKFIGGALLTNAAMRFIDPMRATHKRYV